MRHAVALTALVAAGSFLACSSSSTSSASDAGSPDASEDRTVEASAESGPDAASDAAGEESTPYEAPAAPPLGGIRVANFSATAPPFDFCFAPHGTTKWQGPMLEAAGPQDAGEYGDGSAPGLAFSDGGTTGLEFPGVTSYFYLAPGQYDARFVAAGSPECNVPVVAPDAKTLPAIAKDGLVTIALFAEVGGDAGAAGLKVVGLTDDLGVPPAIGAGRIGVRFINAASSVLAADFGYAPPAFGIDGHQTGPLAIPAYVPIFSGVPYGQASSPSDTTVQPPFVDDHGYVFMPASSLPIGLTASSAGAVAETTFNATLMQDQSVITLAQGPTSVTVGLVLTEVLLVGSPGSGASDGGSDAGSQGGAFQLLQCVDNAGAPGLVGPCSVISQ